MATTQALAPSFVDRQASSFRENQLGVPIGDKLGNLGGPALGSGRINDDAIDRAIGDLAAWAGSSMQPQLANWVVGWRSLADLYSASRH
jgi:hypothetical protein